MLHPYMVVWLAENNIFIHYSYLDSPQMHCEEETETEDKGSEQRPGSDILPAYAENR